MSTPQQLEQQLQSDRLKRQSLNSKINLQKSFSATDIPQPQSLSGLDNLNQQINKTVENLKSKATTEILTLSSELGIQNPTAKPLTLPETCPPTATLDRILNRRDNLISELESGAAFITTVTNILDTVSTTLTGTETTLQILNTIKTATSTALQFIPAAPGGATSALSTFDDIRTLLTFKADGVPRLPEIKRALTNGSNYATQAGVTISKIIQALNAVDLMLEKCGRTPTALGSEINNLIQKGNTVIENQFETSYKGFTFQVIERPFSPTVNRKIGQALNSQGIVLLQTDPSFTNNPQVLIEELKLIIDRDNLKAD